MQYFPDRQGPSYLPLPGLEPPHHHHLNIMRPGPYGRPMNLDIRNHRAKFDQRANFNMFPNHQNQNFGNHMTFGTALPNQRIMEIVERPTQQASDHQMTLATAPTSALTCDKAMVAVNDDEN